MLENLLFAGSGPATITGTQMAKLVASDGTNDDYFGFAVSISIDGKTALIGAYEDDDRGTQSGSAYIFKTSDGVSWSQVAKLVASDGSANDCFGFAVSLSGDGLTALIGAWQDDGKGFKAGSVYVFHNATGNTWNQVTKLYASDGTNDDYFGFAVSISIDGKTALIGAYGDDDQGNTSGSAYIFKNTSGTWLQISKLKAFDAAAVTHFGSKLSLSGDGLTALIGAYGKADSGSNTGAAYVFRNTIGNTWDLSSKLLASDKAASSYFGYAVSISSDGTTALVGAFGSNTNGAFSGAGYVFKNTTGNNWVQRAKLIASDAAASDYLGWSASLSGDGKIALLGSPFDVDNGVSSGSAYLFKTEDGVSWLQSKKLLSADGAASDSFGESVSVSGDGSTVLIGAMRDDDRGNDSGSAYIFK